MRRCAIALLALCSLFTGRLPAQTKKVIANLSPEMLKELAVSAPNVKIVSTRGIDLAKEIEDADAMVGVTLTPELFTHAKKLQWLHITSAGVDFQLSREPCGLYVSAEVKVAGQTGVEMEALTAVSIACLTIYDMLKAVDKAMTVSGIRLIEKTGGRSGSFRAERRSER